MAFYTLSSPAERGPYTEVSSARAVALKVSRKERLPVYIYRHFEGHSNIVEIVEV